MKKYLQIFTALLVLAVLGLVLAGCGSTTSDTTDATDSADKVYTIATDTTFAPFEFENDKGERVGIDVELLDAIAKDQGFKYELSALGFDASLTALEAGQVDGVIAGMSITEERELKFDFSEPYFDSGVVCAVKDDSDITDYEALRGKNVAVKTGTEGSVFADSIKDEYGFTVTTFQDSANMYEEVKAGNSVALFEDYPVIGYAISQGQPFKMIGGLQQETQYGFAVQKDNETGAELLKMFDAGLENVRASGEYQEIIDKYIKE